MKRITFTAAFAAALVSMAAPVLAQSQLEQHLGVEPGRYTTHELAILKAASDQDGGEARVYFGQSGGISASSMNMLSPRAAEIIADFHDDGDNGAFEVEAVGARGVVFVTPTQELYSNLRRSQGDG